MSYKDKEAEKARNKAYYQANKKRILERTKENNKKKIQRNKGYVKEYLQSHPCVDCGEEDIIVLEFDHINRLSKFKTICQLVNKSYSLKAIQDEIDKCQVRCANCHRRKSYLNKDYLPIYNI